MLALRKRLREHGHDARLLASSARPLDQPSQADYECFGLMSQLRGLHQIWNPSAYLTLKRVLREFQPDVVHVRLDPDLRARWLPVPTRSTIAPAM